MSLRRLAQHCAPLLQLLTRTHPALATPGAPSARLASTAAPADQQLFGGETLQQIRHRVFGEHIGNNKPSGRKILRKKLVGDKIASYYGTEGLEKSDPFFVDLNAEGCVLWEATESRAQRSPPHVAADAWQDAVEPPVQLFRDP